MKSRHAHLLVSSLLLLVASPTTVRAASHPPTVRVVAPSPSGELTVGQNFRVTAEAQADAGRRVVKVEFFVWSSNLRVGEACFRVSRDDGVTWGPEQRMPEPKYEHPTGTLFALKPIRLMGGTMILPANRESEHPDPKRGWWSLFYRSTDAGKTWTESPEILSTPGNIQPTIQQLSDGSLLGFFRPRGRNAKLWRSTSHDGGATWAPLERTTLDNPSTRSDFVVLPSGKLVLACNVSLVNRTPVNLLLSDDLGKTWRVNRTIETGPGPYGYCAVLRTRDGKIHVAYDTDRRIIKHLVVDEAWFDEPAVMVDYQRP